MSDALEELAKLRPFILLDRFDEAVAAAEIRIRSMPAEDHLLNREVVVEVAKERLDVAASLIGTIPEKERHAVERAFLTELSLMVGLFCNNVRRRWPTPSAVCP